LKGFVWNLDNAGSAGTHYNKVSGPKSTTSIHMGTTMFLHTSNHYLLADISATACILELQFESKDLIVVFEALSVVFAVHNFNALMRD
jgi:hypothetical protein